MVEPRDIQGAVVVVTGASSGIGRAAALAFAGRGARVVAAARRAGPLEEVAAECRARGGEGLAVPTDVTDADAMRRLAQSALSGFGRIDVWINNAGTGVFGPFAETDVALHRRTIEVNLLGAIYGAHAVLPVFKRQGSGVLINTCSLGGWAPTPFAAAYTASKFGMRGFAAALRAELAEPGIHICSVFPAMGDTPGIEHGANTSDRTIDPGPFLYRAEDVADTMLGLAERPRAEVAVGWPARAGQLALRDRAPRDRTGDRRCVPGLAVARRPGPAQRGRVASAPSRGAGRERRLARPKGPAIGRAHQRGVCCGGARGLGPAAQHEAGGAQALIRSAPAFRAGPW